MKLKRTLKGIILLTGIASLMSLREIPSYYYNYHRNLIDYVETRLPEIAQAEADTLGFQDMGFPFVEYAPKLALGKQYRDSAQVVATYSMTNETICLANILDSNNLNLNNGNNPGSIGSSLSSDRKRIDETLYHEYAHYLFDRFSKNSGKGEFPDIQKYGPSYSIGLKLISEGLANYATLRMTGEKDCFVDSLYPRQAEDFFYSRIIAQGGRHLVKPIVDKYGLRGIKYLMLHPPSNNELKNVTKYQKRVLSALKHKK
jgi:hypothetical protein